MNAVSTNYWIAYTPEDENIVKALGVAANLATGYSYLQTTCYAYPPPPDDCVRRQDTNGLDLIQRESHSTVV